VVAESGRIVLVGLPGAGKSSTGSILAELLDWNFVDLDIEIERATDMKVAALFESRGEAAFRELESELTGRLASETRLVLAPGGGWITNPAHLRQLPDALILWLRVDPETALTRLQSTQIKRPLLDVADPLQRMQQLARERQSKYEQAHAVFDTNESTPRQVAETILEWLTKQKKNASSS
jgi:shikimate kinase